MLQVRYFQPASEDRPNTNDWHAYRDDSSAALCGSASLSYNTDAIADALPAEGELHKGCGKALDKEAKDAEKAAKGKK